MVITLFLILKTGTQNWTPYTITKVEEHWFEEVVLTYPDGHKETYFMPQENDKDGYLYDEDCAWYSCNIRLLDGRNIEYV